MSQIHKKFITKEQFCPILSDPPSTFHSLVHPSRADSQHFEQFLMVHILIISILMFSTPYLKLLHYFSFALICTLLYFS